MPSAPVLVDTNVLLRIAHLETQQDQVMLMTMRRYSSQGLILCITLQNLAEFWNVATRPRKHNGFGRPLAEVAAQADNVMRWFSVTGVLVHDVRLAAIMREYGRTRIFTLNARDFARFPFINPIDPREAN